MMLQALGTSSYPLHHTSLTWPPAAPQGSPRTFTFLFQNVWCDFSCRPLSRLNKAGANEH